MIKRTKQKIELIITTVSVPVSSWCDREIQVRRSLKVDGREVFFDSIPSTQYTTQTNDEIKALAEYAFAAELEIYDKCEIKAFSIADRLKNCFQRFFN